MRLALVLILPAALSGCIAKTALDVATLPVRAASKTMDVLTTSQAEADQKRGKAIRKKEECMGREQKRAERERRAAEFTRCDKYDS